MMKRLAVLPLLALGACESQEPPAVHLPKRQVHGDPNHGKKSRKSNWDCTICRSCRSRASACTVAKKPESSGKRREFRRSISTRSEDLG